MTEACPDRPALAGAPAISRPKLAIYELVLLMLPVLGLYVPLDALSWTLCGAWWVTWRHRHKLHVDPTVKHIALWLVVYLLFFTVVSEDWRRSAKGTYDVLRGLTLFPLGVLLAGVLRRPPESATFHLAAAALLVGNFAFDRGAFYGYHPNANNVAVTVLWLALLAWPQYLHGGMRARGLLALISAAVVGATAWLLYLAQSRAAWAGVAVAAVVLLVTERRHAPWVRISLSAAAVGGLALLLAFFSRKGLALDYRDLIWSTLWHATLAQAPWLGFGLNTVKHLMPEGEVAGELGTTAHNLILEVFVSTGAVGLLWVVVLATALAWHYRRLHLERSGLFYPALAGVLVFLTMSMVDLKFASFRLPATLTFFLGWLYAQRRHVARLPAQEEPGGPL